MPCPEEALHELFTIFLLQGWISRASTSIKGGRMGVTQDYSIVSSTTMSQDKSAQMNRDQERRGSGEIWLNARVGMEGLGPQNRFRRRNLGPPFFHIILITMMTAYHHCLTFHQLFAIIKLLHKYHLICPKILLKRLRLVEVKWLVQDHVIRDIASTGTWYSNDFSLFCTFLFADRVLVLGSNPLCQNCKQTSKERF